MPAVGATVIDVQRELQLRVEKLEPVVATFLDYDQRRNRVVVTTLLDDYDDAAEEQLASIELHLHRSFKDYDFDFSTIHLCGRDPKTLIPETALVVFARRPLNRLASPPDLR